MMAAMETPAPRAQQGLLVLAAKMAVVPALMAPMEVMEVAEEAGVSGMLAAMGPTAVRVAQSTSRFPIIPAALTPFPALVVTEETVGEEAAVDRAAPAELAELAATAPVARVVEPVWAQAAMAVQAAQEAQAVPAVQAAMAGMAAMVEA